MSRLSGILIRLRASTVVLLLAIGYLAYQAVVPIATVHAIERYAAPLDAPRVVHLPDGSRATLAPGARLDYRTSIFVRPRLLTLWGQARFEPRPDTDHPFEVRANGVLTSAGSTVFTVRANAWDPAVWISVEQGTVLAWPDTDQLHAPPHAIQAGESLDVVALNP
jgi:transmembrane sensor